jgi:hypothetical protein
MFKTLRLNEKQWQELYDDVMEGRCRYKTINKNIGVARYANRTFLVARQHFT